MMLKGIRPIKAPKNTIIFAPFEPSECVRMLDEIAKHEPTPPVDPNTNPYFKEPAAGSGPTRYLIIQYDTYTYSIKTMQTRVRYSFDTYEEAKNFLLNPKVVPLLNKAFGSVCDKVRATGYAEGISLVDWHVKRLQEGIEKLF